MSNSTTFIDGQTVVLAAWLNDINNFVYSGINPNGNNSIIYGTTAPVSGTYKQGTIMFNTLPTAGGNIGWVCVASGTPGTWQTWGVIA